MRCISDLAGGGYALAGLDVGRGMGALRRIRLAVSAEIEPKRKAKEIGSSLAAKVAIGLPQRRVLLRRNWPNCSSSPTSRVEQAAQGPTVVVHTTDWHKCGRCWRHLPEVTMDGDLHTVRRDGAWFNRPCRPHGEFAGSASP